jgi:hypothetical protein
MATAAVPFAFEDPPDRVSAVEDFVLRIPTGIKSKANLLSAVASAGQFPGYFGGNWDALLDCLRDFSWIRNRRIVLLHNDLPLHDDKAECQIYLEILQTAIADWSKSMPASTAKAPPGWPYIEHELLVVFPSEVKAAVTSFLAGE